MRSVSLSLVVFALALALAGCSKESPKPAAPAPASPPQRAQGPVPSIPKLTTAQSAFRGQVAERLEAPGYTYLRLTRAEGEAWVAVPTTQVAVGAEVAVVNPVPMQQFESKTLKRTFELIYFGAGVKTASAGSVDAPAHPPMAAHPGPTDAPAAVAQGPVEKASGPDGRRVAELFAQKQALAGKAVAVRGRVVKSSDNILGKNWLHVQDGSGSAAAKDNDLTVTTQDSAQVGEVVLLRGTVRLDRDIGAGYQYPVLLEDARIDRGGAPAR